MRKLITYIALIALVVGVIFFMYSTTQQAESFSLSYRAHGFFEDSSGKAVRPDFAMVKENSEILSRRIRGNLNEGTLKRFDTFEEVINSLKGSERFKLVLKNGIIHRMMREKDSGLHDYADEVMRGALSNALFDTGIETVKQMHEEIQRLRTQSFPDLLRYLEPYLNSLLGDEALVTNYIDRCREEGVPIPPDWPWSDHADPQTLRTGRISANTDFVNGVGAGTHLLVQDLNGDNPGTCMGVFRSGRQFGIICQSLRTGAACFWDNKRVGGGVIPADPNSVIPLSTMQNGEMLQDNCTDCHRGQNAYLTHPRTGTDFTHVFGSMFETDLPQSRWMRPISRQPFWGNPRRERAATQCDGCHELPDPVAVQDQFNPERVMTTDRYCDTVLKNAANRTMPPDTEPVGWPEIANANGTQAIHEFVRLCDTSM